MDGKTSIHIIKPGRNVCLGTFDSAKLTYFSFYARHQLSRGGSTGKVLPNGSITIPGTQAEGKGMDKALIKVLSWVEGNDVSEAQPLTAAALGIEAFPDFVYVHRAAMILRMDRTLRSDAIRNDIIHYIHASPLRFDEFVMLLEVCNFDNSLAAIVKSATMEFKVKGGVPDMARIEGYAQLHGMFGELKRIEQAMVSKMGSKKKAADVKKGGDEQNS